MVDAACLPKAPYFNQAKDSPYNPTDGSCAITVLVILRILWLRIFETEKLFASMSIRSSKPVNAHKSLLPVYK